MAKPRYNHQTNRWELDQNELPENPNNADFAPKKVNASQNDAAGWHSIDNGWGTPVSGVRDGSNKRETWTNGRPPDQDQIAQTQAALAGRGQSQGTVAATTLPGTATGTRATPSGSTVATGSVARYGANPFDKPIALDLNSTAPKPDTFFRMEHLTATPATQAAPFTNPDGSINPVATFAARQVLAGTPAQSADAVRTMDLAHRAANTNPAGAPSPAAQRYASGADFNTSQAAADRRAGKINDAQLGEVRGAADTVLHGTQAGPTDASRAMMSGRIGPAQQQRLSQEAQAASSDAYYRTHPGEAAYRPGVKLGQADGFTIGAGGQTINGQFAAEGSHVAFDAKGKPIITAPTTAPTQPAVIGATGGGSIARAGVPQVNNGVATAQNPQGSFVAKAPATTTGTKMFTGFDNPAFSPAVRGAMTAASGAPFNPVAPFHPPESAPSVAHTNPDGTLNPVAMAAGFSNPAFSPTVRGVMTAANGGSAAPPAAPASLAKNSAADSLRQMASGGTGAARQFLQSQGERPDADGIVRQPAVNPAARGDAATGAPPTAASVAGVKPTTPWYDEPASSSRSTLYQPGSPAAASNFGASDSYTPQPSATDVAKASNGGTLPTNFRQTAPAATRIGNGSPTAAASALSTAPSAGTKLNTAPTPQGALNAAPTAGQSLASAPSVANRFGDRTFGDAASPDGPARPPDGSAVSPNGPARSPDGPARSPDGAATSPDGPARSPDAKLAGTNTAAPGISNPFAASRPLTLGETGRADPNNPVSHMALDPSTLSLPPGPKPFGLDDLAQMGKQPGGGGYDAAQAASPALAMAMNPAGAFGAPGPVTPAKPISPIAPIDPNDPLRRKRGAV